MKKIIVFSLTFILFLITGCNKNQKLVCDSKNDIMDLNIIVEYKNKTIDKMLLNYTYDLTKYDEKDIESFKKQDFCKLIENSSDTFAGAIKYCNQSISDKKLKVKANIDVSKLSNDDITKNSKIESVKNSFENSGSICKIK